ncbi:MAG: hypothetical protein P1V97_34155 [Planctomycetota bacterium]|nr:hypothetical protein [Planctomycetota bacterium]
MTKLFSNKSLKEIILARGYHIATGASGAFVGFMIAIICIVFKVWEDSEIGRGLLCLPASMAVLSLFIMRFLQEKKNRAPLFLSFALLTAALALGAMGFRGQLEFLFHLAEQYGTWSRILIWALPTLVFAFIAIEVAMSELRWRLLFTFVFFYVAKHGLVFFAVTFAFADGIPLDTSDSLQLLKERGLSNLCAPAEGSDLQKWISKNDKGAKGSLSKTAREVQGFYPLKNNELEETLNKNIKLRLGSDYCQRYSSLEPIPTSEFIVFEALKFTLKQHYQALAKRHGGVATEKDFRAGEEALILRLRENHTDFFKSLSQATDQPLIHIKVFLILIQMFFGNPYGIHVYCYILGVYCWLRSTRFSASEVHRVAEKVHIAKEVIPQLGFVGTLVGLSGAMSSLGLEDPVQIILKRPGISPRASASPSTPLWWVLLYLFFLGSIFLNCLNTRDLKMKKRTRYRPSCTGNS